MPGPVILTPTRTRNTSLPVIQLSNDYFEELAPKLPELTAYRDNLTTPLTHLQVIGYSGFFFMTKAAGILAISDGIWTPIRDEADGMLNIIDADGSPGTPLVPVGTPVFDAALGVNSNGSTGHFNTGVNLSTETPNYSLNSAALALGSSVTAANGVTGCGNANAAVSTGDGAQDSAACRINNGGASSVSMPVTNALGLAIGFRRDASNIGIYKDRRETFAAVPSTSITSADCTLCRANGGTHSNGWFNFLGIFAALSPMQNKVLDIAYRWLMRCHLSEGF